MRIIIGQVDEKHIGTLEEYNEKSYEIDRTNESEEEENVYHLKTVRFGKYKIKVLLDNEGRFVEIFEVSVDKKFSPRKAEFRAKKYLDLKDFQIDE